MLFRRPLTRISRESFIPHTKERSWQLRLSTEFLSLVEQIKQDKNVVFQVYGQPGSGTTTLVQGLCQHLCGVNHFKEEEILYISLNQDCNENSLWDLMSELSEEKNDKENATFFLKTSVKRDDKIKAFLALFNFKVICFDNADCNENLVKYLLEYLVDSKIKTFIIDIHENKSLKTNEHVCSMEVKGLNISTAQELFIKLYPQCELGEQQIFNICEILSNNPVAIKLFCAFVHSCQLDNKHLENTLTDLINYSSSQKQLRNSESQVDKCALDWILEYMNQSLASSISVLYKLCHLRKPLPLIVMKPEINNLINLNLLNVKREGSVCFISVDPCLQKHLSCRERISCIKDAEFSVLECWLSLVSDKLQSLVQDAEDNAWPFVPEKWYECAETLLNGYLICDPHMTSTTPLGIWEQVVNAFFDYVNFVNCLNFRQYVQKVNKEENYNVKELLTSRNFHVSSLTELEILQECLYHAYVQDDFKKLAALVFVVDRFLYWQGETKTSIDTVDYIQSKSPETAIAPQLLIRRVRFMKNNGSLQEAEETLNQLLQAKSKIGQWKYRKEHEFRLVSGVCVQIKGEIQYRLGHWLKGASLLIQSIGFFESLPQPDKKGLAASYGLLCLCLRNMTVTDYAVLAQTCGLFQCHPLLAAYFSGQEAAKLSVYTPMFFLRHICQAGEVMLEFVNLLYDKNEKHRLLRVAIEDLKDSIQAHQTYASLTSREQFYLLACAVYKISLALFQLESSKDRERGTILKDLSSQLYDHYCSSSKLVTINEDVIGVIGKCLKLLGLEAFLRDNLPNAGEILVKYCEERTVERLRENTSLSSVGFFAHLRRETPKRKAQDVRVQLLQKTVERAEGKEEIQEELRQVRYEAQDDTVNRLAGTAEVKEEKEQEHQDEETKNKTVDRSAATEEIQEEEKDKIKAPKDTVDRLAGTAEAQEQPPSKLDELSFKTVDQTALTAGINTMEQGGQGIVTQSLVDEAASLPSQTMEISFTTNKLLAKKTLDKAIRVKDAILWRYDFPTSQWRGQPTMVYIGEQLKLAKGKEGSQRNVYTVEFINQDEQLGRYVAKCYRKNKTMQQYENDVLSQMTAKQYVAMFNEQLYQAAKGVAVGDIQFLPVFLLQLVNPSGEVTQVYNAEPYMSGEFIKLTNNTDWKNVHRRTDLVLAYSHFTYQASNGNLIIVDIQGWAPLDNKGCTFLTDPQIHSTVYRCFGTGNFGEEGYDNFWKMHSECNQICRMLRLVRPLNK